MANQLYPGKVTVPTTMFEELPDTVAVTKGQHADLLKRLNEGLAAIRPMERGIGSISAGRDSDLEGESLRH
jgi:hypothetical protein